LRGILVCRRACRRMIALKSSLWPAVKFLILQAVAASGNTQILRM
jgi:hypothetical protein